MAKEKYVLLDTDFISKTHFIRKDDQNKLIDRIMEMQGYDIDNGELCLSDIVHYLI